MVRSGLPLRWRRHTACALLAVLSWCLAGPGLPVVAAQGVEFPGPVPIPGMGEVHCGVRVPWELEGQDFLLLGNDNGALLLVRLISGAQNFSLFASYVPGGHVIGLETWDYSGDGQLGLVAATVDPDQLVFLTVQQSAPFITHRQTVALPEDPGSIVFCGAASPEPGELAVSLPGIDQVAFLGNAGGIWTLRQVVEAGDAPRSLAALDLEDDGVREVISADQGVLSGSLGIFRSGADGLWARAGQVEVAGWPTVVDAADVDGDGRTELAVVLADSPTVQFLEGEAGQLVPAGQAGLSRPAASIYFCRVAGGQVGMFTAVPDQGLVEFLTPEGGGWQLVESYYAGCLPTGLTSADINGDGRDDLVSLGDDEAPTTVMYGREGPGFWGYPALVLNGAPGYSELADFNADGYQDLVVLGSEQPQLSLFLGQADGGLATAPIDQQLAYLAGGPVAVEAGGEAGLELALLDFYTGQLRILTYTGAGGFQPLAERPLGYLPRRLHAADLDGDGNDDLYMARPAPADLLVLYGDGAGNFGDDRTLAISTGAEDVLAVALNQDGRLDLVAVDGGTRVYPCLQDAGGSFSLQAPATAGLGVKYLAAGDLDEDGDLDVVVASRNEESLTFLENPGTGGLVRRVSSLPLDGAPLGLHCADLDQSGHADVAVNIGGEGVLALVTGLGDWGFGSPIVFAVGVNTSSFHLGDFNLDGTPDVLNVDQSLRLGVNLLNLDRTLVAVAAGALSGSCFEGDLHASVMPDRPGPWDLDLGGGENWVALVREGQALLGRLDPVAERWLLVVPEADLAAVMPEGSPWILRLTVGEGEARESLTLDLAAACGRPDAGSGIARLDWERAPWPNPFNPLVQSRISLARSARVTAAVHDLAGRRVAVILDEDLAAGTHPITWNGTTAGRPAAAGLYILKVEGAGTVLARKILLLK